MSAYGKTREALPRSRCAQARTAAGASSDASECVHSRLFRACFSNHERERERERESAFYFSEGRKKNERCVLETAFT